MNIIISIILLTLLIMSLYSPYTVLIFINIILVLAVFFSTRPKPTIVLQKLN